MTLTDDYALFGTPLDPIDEEEGLRKKPIPIEQQVVTDENGRRRFHGAFTGGFSAGFYNTVGTKEGWIPTDFISSRATKANSFNQKPEDYMDDEDMGEFGFAPQKLKTSSKFQSDSRSQKKPADENAFLSNALMENIFKASKETVGYELLTNMGWRPGKGIGPRLTKLERKRKLASHNKTYHGKSGEEAEKEIDEGIEITEKYKDFLFAPDELPIEIAKPKENLHGIGYKGLSKVSVLSNITTSSGHFNLFDLGPEQGSAVKQNRPKPMKIRGQAFGVGAYERDDEDIYGKDDMSNYDFSLPTQDEERRSEYRQKRGGLSRWDPGPSTDVIDGFELDLSDAASALLKKFYPPPIVPKGWQPKLGRKSTRFDIEKPTTTNPTPSQRKNLVEEEAEESKPSKPPIPSMTQEQLHIMLASSESPDSGFKPFASNPDKQSRYEKFMVCVKNNRGDALHLLQPKLMTDWERDRERVEFERAAILYQPLNSAMSKRFVSAGLSQDADVVKKEEIPEDDTKRAVNMKLFGKLTREKVEWHPSKLLCVRFNVKQPYATDLVGVPPNQKSKFDIFGRLEQDEKSSKSDKVETDKGGEKSLEIKEEPVTGSPERKNESDEETERPPLDLFKSIFENSESEEDEEEEQRQEQVKVEENVVAPPVPVQKVVTTPNLPNKKIATGLFANIDFDKLNQRKSQTVQQPHVALPDPKPSILEKKDASIQDQGKIIHPLQTEVDQINLDYEWVEKVQPQKKKKKRAKSPPSSTDDEKLSKKRSRKRRSSSGDDDERSKKKSSQKKKKKQRSSERSRSETPKRSKSKSSKHKKKIKSKKRHDSVSSDG